jgi:hypothetical protein
MVRQHQTQNLEIPGSMLSQRPGMTTTTKKGGQRRPPSSFLFLRVSPPPIWRGI